MSAVSTESGAELLARALDYRRAVFAEGTSSRRKYVEPEVVSDSDLPALPNGWVWARLDAIAEIKGGITKDKKRKPDGCDMLPYLRVANVQRGHLDLTEMKEILVPNDKVDSLLLEPGDVLFNEGGDRDKLGRGWVWNGQIQRCTFQNHVFRARFYHPEAFEPKFISWYANTFGQDYFMAKGKQTTNLASINKTMLSAFPVPVAPIDQQKRIVAEIEKQFSRLDEAVANFRRVKANLKRYKAAVLKAAVEGKLTEEWRKAHPAVEPASKLLDRILAERRTKWEEAALAKIEAKGNAPKNDKWKAKYKEPATPNGANFSELPGSWKWTTYDQVGKLQLGRQRAPKYHAGPNMRPYLRVRNVFEDRIDLSDVMEMDFPPSDFAKYELKPSDLLLNEGQSPELLGRPAIYQGELPGACFTNTLIRFRAIEGVIVQYALLVSRHYMHSGRFVDEGTITTNIAHLSVGRLATVEFPLPSTAEQARIVAEVDRHLSLIRETESQVDSNLKRAGRLRQSILSRAFSGKLPGTRPEPVVSERP